MIIKKSEKDERREKIIDVAFRLFVDKKIESVTMGEIAKEAGIGRATLFRYFPGKLELVIAVNTKEWKEYFRSKKTNEFSRRYTSYWSFDFYIR